MLDKFISEASKFFFSLESPLYFFVITIVFSLILVFSYCKMDLMRFIQECKGNSQSSVENKEKLKEIYKQKDNHIKQLESRVHELEQEINKLEKKNQDSISSMRIGDGENKDILLMLKRYEDLISKVMADNDKLRQDKNLHREHVCNLERSFNDLMDKYNKAKNVIAGLRENETGLYSQKEKYENIIKIMENKLVKERIKNTPINLHTIKSYKLKDDLERRPSKTCGNKGDYRLVRKSSAHH